MSSKIANDISKGTLTLRKSVFSDKRFELEQRLTPHSVIIGLSEEELIDLYNILGEFIKYI